MGNKLIDVVSRRIRSRGLFFMLGLISIIGFVDNSFRLFTGNAPLGSIPYPNILLGIGLIIESQIARVLKSGKPNSIPKLITFLVGASVMLGGFVALIGVDLTGIVGGLVLASNAVATIVIFYELFFID